MKFLSPIFILFHGLVFLQGSIFQFELFVGANQIHHHRCQLEDPSTHRGQTLSTGVRLNFDISNRFTIVAGYTAKNIISKNYNFQKEEIIKLDFIYKIGTLINLSD